MWLNIISVLYGNKGTGLPRKAENAPETALTSQAVCGGCCGKWSGVSDTAWNKLEHTGHGMPPFGQVYFLPFSNFTLRVPEYFSKRQTVKEVTHKRQRARNFAKIIDIEKENNMIMCFGESHKGEHYQPDSTFTNE